MGMLSVCAVNGLQQRPFASFLYALPFRCVPFRWSPYDCVVIGGGLRIPPKSLALFETVVNIIHKAAPKAAIAFNTRPEDTADAAARHLMTG
jgi:hypothetical protein